MKSEVGLPEEKELDPIIYPRGFETQFADFMEQMTRAVVKQYKNETLNELNKGTIDKFEDAQVGNYASIFTKLSNGAKRKIKKRFSDDRISKKVTQILKGIDRTSKKVVFSEIEDEIGISSKNLIAKEGLTPQINALIQESIGWVKRNLDETLADLSANSLRAMSQGADFSTLMTEFNKLASKRVESSAFVARNQVANFNSNLNKIRYQNIGITEAVWVTARDERVRHSHEARDGKTFKLSEGLYTSTDGKTLMPGMDFNCRCIYRAIIPKLTEDK